MPYITFAEAVHRAALILTDQLVQRRIERARRPEWVRRARGNTLPAYVVGGVPIRHAHPDPDVRAHRKGVHI